MSKLLLIEPSKILQQAIIRALVPQHEIQVMETVPETVPETGCEAMIVDAAALRDRGALDANTARAIQSFPVPIVWLEAKDQIDVPSRERLAVVVHPIIKDALMAALAQCLLPTAASNGKEVTGTVPGATASEADPTGKSAEVIELVEVVDEEPRKDKNTP